MNTTELPCSLGSLSSLTSLILDSNKIVSLPDSFSGLSSLQQLDMRGCSSIQRLPNSFGSLISLRKVILKSCPNFMNLSDGFGSLSNLKRLDVRKKATAMC